MVRPDDRILVAVSGGPDSIGLLAILERLRSRLGIELVCGHVNHRLRGADADADEEVAAAAARRFGVPFVRAEAPAGLAARGNLEARAREVRYRLLHRLAAENGCRLIATAHTRDDQAETLLLRLVRGTGSQGLRGIQPIRADGVIRPLLDCSRESVRGVVTTLGLQWREDTTNQDLRYQRNVVRMLVLPLLCDLNPRAIAALARAARLIAGDATLLETLLAERLRSAGTPDGLNVDAIREVPEPAHGHLVRHWLLTRGFDPRRLNDRHVHSILSLIEGSKASGSVALPDGWSVRRRYGTLSVLRNEENREARPWRPRRLKLGEELHLPGGWVLKADPIPLASGCTWPRDLWRAWCDVTGAAAPFRVRRARHGERVRPLGVGGSRTLADLFTDRKVPASERWVYPVVELDGQVLWVPGVVRTEAFLVGADAERAVLLSAERIRGEEATEPGGRGGA